MTVNGPFILTGHPALKPIVQPIDDWFTNRKLGLVFEARVGEGKLLACSADLQSDLDSRPAARQLRTSLEKYLASPNFLPATVLEPADLDALLRPVSVLENLGARPGATSEEPGYEAAKAMDHNPGTLWHTAYSEGPAQPPHDFSLHLPEPTAITAVVVTQRQDKNRNGQVKELAILVDGRELARAKLPMHVKNHRIDLPADTRCKHLILRISSAHSGPFAALAEVDVIPGAE